MEDYKLRFIKEHSELKERHGKYRRFMKKILTIILTLGLLNSCKSFSVKTTHDEATIYVSFKKQVWVRDSYQIDYETTFSLIEIKKVKWEEMFVIHVTDSDTLYFKLNNINFWEIHN